MNQHYWICDALNNVIDIIVGSSKQEARERHCKYWNEPLTPDQYNRYNVYSDDEFNKIACPF